MKKLSRLTAIALLLVFVTSVTSYGWSDTGHMAVAFIAYRKLTPQARARVNALVRLNPSFNAWSSRIPAGTSAAKKRMMLFMIAATWPDEIKGDGLHHADGPANGNKPPDDGTADRNIGYSDTAMHKYWHFIDKPFSPDGTPLEDPPAPNAETQIAAFRAVLASDSPDELKSYDLMWLLHLVGDVHQPLHCTARFIHGQPHGDDGGNLVTVRDGIITKKLHGFWDGLLGTSRAPAVAITVGQNLAAAPAAQANNLDASDWINDGFADAKSLTYKNPPIGVGAGTFTITSSYRKAARTLARKRVALAGARLANILNAELK
ncbi:MAG TPA: S1/P1 nuclease [Pyrinomonadaceae bacterium]|nr:S1/P1 nuclease [Pyrinomonadaceae bacterium]